MCLCSQKVIGVTLMVQGVALVEVENALGFERLATGTAEELSCREFRKRDGAGHWYGSSI